LNLLKAFQSREISSGRLSKVVGAVLPAFKSQFTGNIFGGFKTSEIDPGQYSKLL
jgi:hypothetical protein